MIFNFLPYTYCLCFVLLAQGIHAQGIANHILSTAGASWNTNDYQLDWTIGETFVQEYETSMFRVQEGFHQLTIPGRPTSSPKSSAPEAVWIYPNPASNHIQVKSPIQSITSIRIFNAMGQLINMYTIPFQIIDVSKFDSGMYLAEINYASGSKAILKFVKS